MGLLPRRSSSLALSLTDWPISTSPEMNVCNRHKMRSMEIRPSSSLSRLYTRGSSISLLLECNPFLLRGNIYVFQSCVVFLFSVSCVTVGFFFFSVLNVGPQCFVLVSPPVSCLPVSQSYYFCLQTNTIPSCTVANAFYVQGYSVPRL